MSIMQWSALESFLLASLTWICSRRSGAFELFREGCRMPVGGNVCLCVQAEIHDTNIKTKKTRPMEPEIFFNDLNSFVE